MFETSKFYYEIKSSDRREKRKMTVFNKNKVDFTKEKIFFGEALNTQRFDDFKYSFGN